MAKSTSTHKYSYIYNISFGKYLLIVVENIKDNYLKPAYSSLFLGAAAWTSKNRSVMCMGISSLSGLKESYSM